MLLFRKLFDDKRWTIALLLTWMVTVCSIFYVLGAFHMPYMHVGPGDKTEFMGLKIDSWGKWTALAVFSFFNTCINEFISNALDPWFLNSLQDHKTRSIEYSHATCLWIVQIHCMYVHVMGVFALFLFFSQVDFALIRLLADWIVTGYSTVWFIQDKEVVAVQRSGRGAGAAAVYTGELHDRHSCGHHAGQHSDGGGGGGTAAAAAGSGGHHLGTQVTIYPSVIQRLCGGGGGGGRKGGERGMEEEEEEKDGDDDEEEEDEEFGMGLSVLMKSGLPQLQPCSKCSSSRDAARKGSAVCVT